MIYFGVIGEGPTVEQVDVRTNLVGSGVDYTAVNFGDSDPNRYITVFAWHSETTTTPSLPTCNIAGGSATRINALTTGTGTGPAIGAAIFTRALPTGTSGNVEVSWGGVGIRGIVVLRTTRHNMSAAHDTLLMNATTTNGSGNINIPDRGLLFLIAGRRLPDQNPVSFTNATQRGTDIVFDARRAWGWDANLSAETGRTVTVTPWTMNSGYNAALAASFARL